MLVAHEGMPRLYKWVEQLIKKISRDDKRKLPQKRNKNIISNEITMNATKESVYTKGTNVYQ